MKKEFHGTIPPVITPLDRNRQLDVPGLEKLLDHMISGGVHGLFILGTTGEGPLLGRKLQQQMITETLRIVANRLPVIVGVSSASLGESIDLAVFARKAGAAAAVSAPPCYQPLADAELYDYYAALVKESATPLFIYNMPSMTKIYLKPELICRIARIPGVRGCKDSSGNMFDFHTLLLELGGREDFSLLCGPDELTGEAVLMGADGGVNSGANLEPELYVSLYNAAAAGNIAELRKLQRQIYAFRKLYYVDKTPMSIILGIKAGLKARGICEPYPTLPAQPLGETETARIVEILDQLKH